jgi:hypothetical protein
MHSSRRTQARFAALSLTVLVTLSMSLMAQQVMQGPTTIRQNVHHDVSLPLREMVKNAAPPELTVHEAEEMKHIPLPPGLSTLTEDPALQTLAPVTPSPAVGLSFEGLGQGQYAFTVQYIPPDTNGAVGANQYVQWVNASFAIFDKSTGAKLLGPVAGNVLWSGFGGGCQTNNNGDPVVQYDKLANRWVMSQFSVSSTPYLQCVAVSQTSDATGAWYRYSFSYGNSDFDDYPKMGVWPDAYYETFNMFLNGQTFIGADACAYDRNKMLAGLAATQQCFQQNASVGGLLPSDLDGTTPPPTGSPNYMVYFGTNTLNLYKFHVDWTTPTNSTFTGPTVINVAAFNPLCNGGQCVAEPGGSTLDSLGDRLMHRLAYRNFGTHESLVVTHSVVAGSSGGVRWYEIQNPSGTPALAQQSTYAPDAAYRWMGSVAMDRAGDLAVGYSKSSSSIYPSVAFAGRLATDPVNTLQAETLVVSGTGSQNYNTNNRWGDYSALTVDPVDDCTFWYTQEYIKTTGSFNWNTRIANFKFTNCGSQVTINPTSLTFGSQVVGTSSTSQPVTLTNSGTSAVTGISISASGDFSETDNCGTTLAANSSCTINVTFTPTAVGTRTGTLTVTDSAGTQTASLSGTGVANVSLSPSTVPFGNQGVGTTSSPQVATLTNGQNVAVTSVAVSITGANAGDFAQTNNCGTTLAANSSCTINVTFTPAGYGARSATLTVTDSAGTQTSALTGTGTDITPPTTQITAPANNATVSGVVTVTATASDNVGVTSIQIYIDGTQAASGTTSPLNYSWNTGNVTNGTHTIFSKAFDAAGNLGTSTTVTVTVNNSLQQLIQNPGFETGNLTSWNAGGVFLPVVTTARHNTGSYSALLGSSTPPEPNGDSWLYQTVTIPSSTTAASLNFSYWGACADTVSNDWQEAQIQSSTGTTLAQVMKVCDNGQTWKRVYFNLLPYKGQTIRIYFNDHGNGNGLLTYMYLDDVTVSVKGGASVTLSPASLNFGNQNVGTTSSSQPLTLANNQTSALTGVSVSITGTNASDFAETDNCGTSVAANSSCTINVTFTPSASGARSATLTVTDSAGTQTSTLSGTGVGSVTLTPASLTYGNQNVGTTSSPQPLTLTNGGASALTGISVSVTGSNAGDYAQTNNCGTTIAANSSCTVNVTFTPTASGTRTATLTVTDSAGTQTASLSGTGVGSVTLTPPGVSFGSQGVGTTSSAQTLTLTNGNNTALTSVGVSIVGTNAGDFGQTNNCGTSVAANSSCTINVKFTPSIYGAESATLSVTDSAGTQTSSLTGTGTDITAPTTQITAPTNGATVSGTVTVTATASDNVGVTSIQIYIDGAQVASGTTPPLNYSWNTANASNGTHTIYSKASDAAGNVGTSTTITVTVNNGVSQLIQNSGFETGNLANWTASGAYLPFVTTGHAHAGIYSAQLGASVPPEPVSDSAVYQTVTIPSTAVGASLNFYYWGSCADVVTNDWQGAQIQNTSGATLAQVMKVCDNNKVWTHVYFNLLPYKGQTIRVYFNTHQNGNGLLTYMYLDDVTVSVK